MNQKKKLTTIIGIVVVVVVSILFVVILVKGVSYSESENGINLSGGIFYHTEISYDEITQISMKDEINLENRDNGVSLGNYKLGYFNNSEYGSFTAYVNTDIHKYIVIQYYHQDQVNYLIFNQKDMNETERLYKSIAEKAPQISVMQCRVLQMKDTTMIILNQGESNPECPATCTDENHYLADFTTGDLLYVITGPILESYPSQTTLLYAELIEKGSVSDIDAELIKQLEDMGYYLK